MLTLSAGLATSVRGAAPEVIWRVDIGEILWTSGATADWVASYHWPPRPGVAHLLYSRPYLANLSEISYEIDPLTGASKVSGVTAALLDNPQTRATIANNRLVGKEFTVFLGSANLTAFTQWAYAFKGVVRWAGKRGDYIEIEAEAIDYVPETVMGGVGVGQRLAEQLPNGVASGYASIHSGPDSFSSVEHPLTTIWRTLSTVVGVPARYIDATSMDYQDAANDDIEPYRLDRSASASRDNRILDSVSALEACREIAYLSGGILHIREEGTVRFRLFDPSGSSVYEFSDSRDIEGPVESYSRAEDVIGTIRINTHWAQQEDGSGSSTQQYLARFTLQVANTCGQWGFKIDDSEDQHHDFEISDKWFGAAGVNQDAWDHTINSIELLAYDVNAQIDWVPSGAGGTYGFGWPGLGYNVDPGVGNIAADPISAGKPGYVVFYDDEDDEYALYKYTGSSLDTTDKTVTLTGLTKIGGDNIDVSAGYLRAYDVTAQMGLAYRLMERHADNAVTIKITTNLKSYAVQVGDLVTLDTTEVVCYGFTGDTGATKFEVVGKAIEPETGRIHWTLLQAQSQSPGYTYATRPWNNATEIPQFNPAAELNATIDRGKVGSFFGQDTGSGFDATIITDAVLAAAAGLTHTLPELTIGIGGFIKILPPVQHTFTASRDTYIFVGGSPHSRARVSFSEVTNYAAEPATPSGFVPWLMVRTDGSDVTAVTQIGNRGMVGSVGLRPEQRLTGYGAENLGAATIDGFNVSVVAGLTAEIAVGVAMVDGTRVERKVARRYTATASRQVFVDIDASGTLNFSEVALGADEPILMAAGKTRVAAFETDATDVVKVWQYPEKRTSRTTAVDPAAIRTWLVPNGAFQDLDANDAIPHQWEADPGTDATIEACTGYVKAGRYAVDCNIEATATTSYLRGVEWSGVFPIRANERATLLLSYTRGGYGLLPELSVGLEYYDSQVQSLGTRYLWSATVPSSDVTDEGGRLSLVIDGAGADADQVPPTARYARVVFMLDANGAGDAGIVISDVTIERTSPAGGVVHDSYSDATATGSQVSDNAGSWTDAASVAVTVPLLSHVAGRTVQVEAVGSLSFSGDTVGDYLQARLYDSTNAVASTDAPIQRIDRAEAANTGQDKHLSFRHVFEVPDGTSATIKLQFQRSSGSGQVDVDSRSLVCTVLRNADD